MPSTFDQPRHVSALFLRLGLGSLFLAGLQHKLQDPAALYAQVASSHLLAPPFDALFATALPYWELAFGVCFLLGLFTRWAALAAFLALTSYSIYVAQPSSQAHLASVGLGPVMLSHDITFMLMTVALCISGAGAYSLDSLLAARRLTRPRWLPAKQPNA
jgi:uncharacterized membrane protein YphA (DoxX/SURF4 family)